MKDLRKNWTRDISLCIKLLKCKLIQILKRSLNLRDCFSHFVLKNWYYRCLYFFLLLLFYPWATPQVLTVDQLKKDCFSLCEKRYHRCLSICLLLLFHTKGLSQVPEKKIDFLAKQTICLRTLNEQTPMRKYLCVYWRNFQSSSLGVCCLNEIPFVASCLSARKRKRIQSNVKGILNERNYRLLKILDRKCRFLFSLFMVYFSVVSKWCWFFVYHFRAIKCPKLFPILLSSRFTKIYWIQNWPK